MSDRNKILIDGWKKVVETKFSGGDVLEPGMGVIKEFLQISDEDWKNILQKTVETCLKNKPNNYNNNIDYWIGIKEGMNCIQAFTADILQGADTVNVLLPIMIAQYSIDQKIKSLKQ